MAGAGFLLSRVSPIDHQLVDENERPGDAVQAVSVSEAARSLGIDAAEMRRLIDEGKVPVIKVGSRTVVPVRKLAELSEKLLDDAGA